MLNLYNKEKNKHAHNHKTCTPVSRITPAVNSAFLTGADPEAHVPPGGRGNEPTPGAELRPMATSS